MVYRAVDLENRVFDVYPESTPGAKEAREVFAAKSQLYKLPSGIVKSTAIINDGSTWKGSEVTVSIVNTFEYPISLQLKAQVQGGKVKATGVPTEPLELLPNERKELRVSWAPDREVGIQLKKTKFSFNAVVQMQHPEYDKPLRFTGSTGVPIKKP